MSKPAMWMDGPDVKSEFAQVVKLTHPLAATALAFWDSRPADGLVIGRDVPSRAIASLLSRIIVYEPVEGGRDLKVHLVGTVLRRRFGNDITGKRMSELFSASNFPVRLRVAMAAIEEGKPQFAVITHTHRAIGTFRIEVMQMPVLAPDGVTPWVVTFIFYLD